MAVASPGEIRDFFVISIARILVICRSKSKKDRHTPVFFDHRRLDEVAFAGEVVKLFGATFLMTFFTACFLTTVFLVVALIDACAFTGMILTCLAVIFGIVVVA